MRSKDKQLCFLLTGLMTACTFIPSLAQEAWEKEREGEIKDLEIELTKERQVTLPRASRYFEKVPPRAFEPVVPAITYEIPSIPVATPNYIPLIRPLRIKQEDLTRLYSNYLSAGVGNFTSFMVDGSVATKRDKKKMLGADFFWRSFGKGPVDGDNSAQSITRFNAFGNVATDHALFGGRATYLNRRGYFYGYTAGTDVDRDVLKQVYDVFSVGLSLENKKKSDLNYRIEGGHSRLADAYVTSETEWSVTADASYLLKEDKQVSFLAEMFFIQRTDSAFNQNRNLIRLQPTYTFSPLANLTLTAGFNMVITDDTFVDGSGGFKAFPHVKGEYRATDRISAYLLLTGNVDKVNLHTLTGENFWLDANQPVLHTERAIQVDGGFSTALGSRFNGRLGLSLTTFRSPYFYTTARELVNPAGTSTGVLTDKFELVFDKAMSQLNPYVEASYHHADAFSLTLRGDYFNYKTDLLAEAWHRPTYRVDFRAQYNLYDKLHIQAGLGAQGGMKVVDPTSAVVSTLDAAADLTMKARYFLSRQLSAFVQLDNILANQYPIYYNYPARGFQGMVGVSWSF
jgi:hypothetical protein